MANYQAPASPVLQRLLRPLADAYSRSRRRYDCKELGDPDFLEAGVSRCLGTVGSGRDFLQRHADGGRGDIELGLFFKALGSGRRLENLESVNLNLTRPMASRCADPFAGIAELSGFDIYAGDGHFHEAACHDPHKPGKPTPIRRGRPTDT